MLEWAPVEVRALGVLIAFFGGKIYEGWSTVPAQFKAPDYNRPGPSLHAVRIFSFTW